MYGVTVNPCNTTGRIGASANASGGTGRTSPTTFTRYVFVRACGSKSITSTSQLGATRHDHQQVRGFDFWVMRDPWHNEFCVLQTTFADLLNQRPPWPAAD
jgi:hypothetical protein